MNQWEFGKISEMQALAFLGKQGYELFATNYRAKGGELDIVMKDGDTLVIVEVKASRSLRMGLPRERVGLVKRRKIVGAAFQFIAENKWPGNVRFDVVEIMPGGLINHIKRAFDLNDVV